MRTSRGRALLLVATLSLGTFAFSQVGSLTGEFQNSPENSVPNNNGDSAKADNIYGQDGNVVDVTTEQTGNFESYSGPRRYIGGNGDTARANQDSTGFGSLTGDFQSSGENGINPHAEGTQVARKKGVSQPSSMGSNASNTENENSGASSSTPSTTGAGQ